MLRRPGRAGHAATALRKDVTLRKEQFEALSNFRYHLRRFLSFSEHVTAASGITHLQYLLMLHVKGYPGRDWATISELAERLLSLHHGVVALVTRCEKIGLVERRPGRLDGREVEVHLTPAGGRLVASLARRHRDELDRVGEFFRVPDASMAAPATPERGRRRSPAERKPRPATGRGAAVRSGDLGRRLEKAGRQ